jgi:hypothetical protein
MTSANIEHISNGRVQLSTGTLYGALRRLLEDEWIERFEQGRQLARQAGVPAHTSRAASTATGTGTYPATDARRRGTFEGGRGLNRVVGIQCFPEAVPAGSTGIIRR